MPDIATPYTVQQDHFYPMAPSILELDFERWDMKGVWYDHVKTLMWMKYFSPRAVCFRVLKVFLVVQYLRDPTCALSIDNHHAFHKFNVTYQMSIVRRQFRISMIWRTFGKANLWCMIVEEIGMKQEYGQSGWKRFPIMSTRASLLKSWVSCLQMIIAFSCSPFEAKMGTEKRDVDDHVIYIS